MGELFGSAERIHQWLAAAVSHSERSAPRTFEHFFRSPALGPEASVHSRAEGEPRRVAVSSSGAPEIMTASYYP
jgi:hypothetical protein